MLNNRIKKLRKTLNLTQKEFSEKLGTSRDNIAGYETGRRLPSDAVVSLICKTFNVNKDWLCTGVGNMFNAQSRKDEIADAVSRLLTGESDSLKSRLILALSRLNENQWSIVEDFARQLLDNQEQSTSAPAPAAYRPVSSDQEIENQVNAYRQALIQEKISPSFISSAKESGVG